MPKSKWLSFELTMIPTLKTPDNFDFNFQPLPARDVIVNLSNISFIDRKETTSFVEPPGIGKTHLAVALGVEACRAGYGALFRTARQSVRDLCATRADDSLDKLFRKWDKMALLILEEWFSDPVIASAILDRLLHHKTIVSITDESYRIMDRKLSIIKEQEINTNKFTQGVK